MAKFIVKQGAKPGTEIPIEGQRLVFGRADDCEIIVPDVSVSRHHAQALVLDGLVALMDLNSSNGTYVNELPISRIFLMDGDEIRLGETVLLFSDESEDGREFTGAPVAVGQRLRPPGSVHVQPSDMSSLEQINHTQLFAPIPDDLRTDALKEIYQKLKALYRVFHEIAQASSLKDIFEAVGRTMTLSIDAERAVFFLSAEKTGGAWQRYFVHTAAKLDAKAAAKPEAPEVLERAHADKHLVQAHVDESGKVHFADKEANTIGVPLVRGGKLAALIYVDNPASHASFTKNDVDFVSTLALQVSVRLNQFEQVQHLKQENIQLRQKIDSDYAVIVTNERMKEIMALTSRVAESDSTVMITGESGTGKELIARSIHHFSRRASKPLIAVNCAALPDTLLESELFGHEKGAFTGALERRIGKFELADGGTLFLDEIGDISAPAQAKLLRVLQEGEIQRVGGNKVIKVNVRVIVATNKDLAAEVEKGNFRQDLLFRIKVIEMTIPPLRERKDDIPALAEYFLKQLRHKIPTSVRAIAPETLEALMNYSFPGNVRELRNIVERGLVFARGEMLLPEHLPSDVFRESNAAKSAKPAETPAAVVVAKPAAAAPEPAAVAAAAPAPATPISLLDMEKKHILTVLRFAKGNKLRAANLLGISRTTLYEKLKTYGINAEEIERESDVTTGDTVSA